MDKPGEYGPPWGVGPEFTASGGPQETYGSGDRAFSPISAPARPPLAPLVHPPESHSLEISRVKHLTLHTCGPPPQRGGSPFVSDRAAAEADATAGIPCGGGPARGKARRRVPPRVWSWILATFCGLRKGRKAAGVAGGGGSWGSAPLPHHGGGGAGAGGGREGHPGVGRVHRHHGPPPHRRRPPRHRRASPARARCRPPPWRCRALEHHLLAWWCSGQASERSVPGPQTAGARGTPPSPPPDAPRPPTDPAPPWRSFAQEEEGRKADPRLPGPRRSTGGRTGSCCTSAWTRGTSAGRS